MTIDNAILGFPNSDRGSSYSLAECLDRRNAAQCMAYRHGPTSSAYHGEKLTAYAMHGADYVQAWKAIDYLRGTNA